MAGSSSFYERFNRGLTPRINRANALGARVQMLWLPLQGGAMYEAYEKRIWTRGNQATVGAGQMGVEGQLDGVSDSWIGTASGAHLNTGYGTFFAWMPRIGGSDTFGGIWLGTSTGSSMYFQITNSDKACSFGSSNITHGLGTVWNTTNTSICWTRTSAGVANVFINGVAGVTPISSGTAFVAGAKTLHLGKWPDGTDWDVNCDLLIAGFTTDVWDAARCKAFHDFPLQLVESDADEEYFSTPVAAATALPWHYYAQQRQQAA